MPHRSNGTMTAALILITLTFLTCVSEARAEVVIETVTVGNPGNAGELSGTGAGGWGPDGTCGAVDYVYKIAKFEVTNGQYTEFLNAVADDDTYGLYNEEMWTHLFGCKIERTGSPGSYSYSVASVREDRPVNYVSWGDAARFANWLHNGQPTGAQGLGTTEDGSYYLNGSTSNEDLVAVVREADATWVIPSEDEWYKAAYHYNDGITSNYYDFPTSSDVFPSNVLVNPDPGNNATFLLNFVYTIGDPYYFTEFGAHENSDSPYGTFDQGGNVMEWNESVLLVSACGRRAGAFSYNGDWTSAAYRGYAGPIIESNDTGFRLAKVGDLTIPTLSEWGVLAMTLLMLTAGTVVFGRRRPAAG